MDDEFLLQEIDSFFAAPSPAAASVDSETINDPSETESTGTGSCQQAPLVGDNGRNFSAEEDEKLRHLAVEMAFDWPRIARLFPGKTTSQVARRWTCKLDPSIKKTKWSFHEDREIERLQSIHGNNWKLIAQALPGRPPFAVKSRFYNSVKKKGESKTPPLRPIRQMQPLSFDPHPHLQSLGHWQEDRVTTLRKQLAGLEALMTCTKAELHALKTTKQ